MKNAISDRDGICALLPEIPNEILVKGNAEFKYIKNLESNREEASFDSMITNLLLSDKFNPDYHFIYMLDDSLKWDDRYIKPDLSNKSECYVPFSGLISYISFLSEFNVAINFYLDKLANSNEQLSGYIQSLDRYTLTLFIKNIYKGRLYINYKDIGYLHFRYPKEYRLCDPNEVITLPSSRDKRKDTNFYSYTKDTDDAVYCHIDFKVFTEMMTQKVYHDSRIEKLKPKYVRPYFVDDNGNIVGLFPNKCFPWGRLTNMINQTIVPVNMHK